MVKGGRRSSVRGALYESASIAAVYGTVCSLLWESWGRPEFWYASTRKPRGKWLFCEAKRAFPPTWRVLECGKRVWKTQTSPPSASGAFEAFGCRCPVSPVLAPAACAAAAVRFGLLLSTLSRLTGTVTHIL
jgi:hypothetical protein